MQSKVKSLILKIPIKVAKHFKEKVVEGRKFARGELVNHLAGLEKYCMIIKRILHNTGAIYYVKLK